VEPQISARYSRHRRDDHTEGVACARAGATIVHLHAYDGGGQQTCDWQVYARIIEGIRNAIDVPVYPSFEPLMISDLNAGVADLTARFCHAEQLAAGGLIEFAFADPGSINFTQTRTTLKAEPAGTYLNPETHTR
jgi:3-keto-5-aminohexanoate cleavage enzyme